MEKSDRKETLPFRFGDKLTTDIPGIGGLLTMTENFEAAYERYGDKILYRFRRLEKRHIVHTLSTNQEFFTYEFGEGHQMTYREAREVVTSLSSGILLNDSCLKQGSRVGIFLSTSVEWSLCLQAILRAGMCVTTVYATLGWETLKCCLNESEISSLVCAADNVENIDRYLGSSNCPELKNLIVVGDIHYKSKYFKCKSIWQIIQDGYKSPNPLEKPIIPKPEDDSILMYTSGSTGRPKGVLIQHQQFISNVGAMVRRLKFTSDDVHLSYLPLAHILEMCGHCCTLFTGGEIVFGSPRTLFVKPGGAKSLGDIDFARPSFLFGVPKVFESLKKVVFAKLKKKTPMERFLFNLVLNMKMKKFEDEEESDDKEMMELVDKEMKKYNLTEDEIFKDFRAMLGGNIRMIMSGGAALNPETHRFLKICLGEKVSIVQGYGATEACGGISIQELLRKDVKVEEAGPPISSVEMKIVSCPEMNYFVDGEEQPRGELWIRGPSVSRGYFKNLQLTNESFTKDGWFLTGDIVQHNVKDGTISVIDRKKNVIKLNNGEFVATEHLEGKYGLSSFVSANGLFIHVEPYSSHIVAILIPDSNVAKTFSKENEHLGLGEEMESIIQNEEYRKAVEKNLLEIGEMKQMRKEELLTLDRFVIRNDSWTPQNGCLTAASKLKRSALRRKYQDEFDRLYGKKKGKIVEEEEEGEEDVVDDFPSFFSVLKPNFV